MPSRSLHQIGDRRAERRRHLAQRGDGGIRPTAFDLDQIPFAHAGEGGEAIQRQTPVAAPIADAAGDDFEQLAFFQNPSNTLY
jgi:hypothetical protein